MKPISSTTQSSRYSSGRAVCRPLLAVIAALSAVTVPAYHAAAETISQTLCVRAVDKVMNDGATVTFWGYTSSCNMMMGGGAGQGQVPGTLVEVGTNDTLDLTLNMNMMTPQEAAPYAGHTVHMHGADLPAAIDGVPETVPPDAPNANPVNNSFYSWTPTDEMAGSYFYHCHVHTVKHLEMGMYGALIVRPRITQGAQRVYLDQLTFDAATAYDDVQTYLFSTVDPAYHASAATGDSTVFADYNPKYFLINGNEGNTTSTPAVTHMSAPNKKVALRLIGVHSVQGTFSILDSAGNPQSFTVYVQDGRQWPAPETMKELNIGPGQRFDIIFTTPAAGGTSWYPQFAFKKLRDNSPYEVVYGRVDF